MEELKMSREIADQVGLSEDEFKVIAFSKNRNMSFSYIGKIMGMTKQGAHYLFQRGMKKMNEYGYEYIVTERLTRRDGYV